MSHRSPVVTFLLVDDHPENLEALEALLRRDGLKILLANSGPEALELVLAHDVGLAIIDVQMPGMDGFELATLMRGTERSRRVPIIFVTAGVHDTRRVFEGYDAGAVDFLHKPLEPRILRNKAATFFELARHRLELAETLRFHETFVAALGHDLRNPLNSISMASQILARTCTAPEQQQVVNLLGSSTKRMSLMIDQLFDLSRSRLTGGVLVERHKGDLAPTLRAIVEEHRLTSHAPIELEERGDGRGHWDLSRMAQVVSNLISNAARHGKAGAPIHVSLAGDETETVIAVHNQGSIAPEVQEHLFDPFVSSRDRRHAREGLGLGLYIVEQIVLAHGGKIEVTSTAQSGTTFRLRLPRAAEAQRTSPLPCPA